MTLLLLAMISVLPSDPNMPVFACPTVQDANQIRLYIAKIAWTNRLIQPSAEIENFVNNTTVFFIQSRIGMPRFSGDWLKLVGENYWLIQDNERLRETVVEIAPGIRHPDLNYDGKVDSKDIVIMSRYWLQ